MAEQLANLPCAVSAWRTRAFLDTPETRPYGAARSIGPRGSLGDHSGRPREDVCPMSDPADKRGPGTAPDDAPRKGLRSRAGFPTSADSSDKVKAQRQADAQAELDAEMRGRGMAYGMRMAAELVGAVIVGGCHRLGPGLVARHQALAVSAVLRVGVRSRRPQRGEGLRADAEGVHGQDGRPHRPQRARTTRTDGESRGSTACGKPRAAGMPDPIHQFEIHTHRARSRSSAGTSRSPTPRLFMLMAVAADRRLLHAVDALARAGAGPACSRWPRSATSSWPACCAKAPGMAA